MKPEKLFRYRALVLDDDGRIKERSIREIMQPEIFLATPESLNDPFEFCVSSNLELLGDLEATRQKLAKALPEEGLTADVHEDVLRMLRAMIREEMRSYWNGVACFQEVNDCVLTWAHYACGHSGICIEYDPSKIGIAELKEVNYQPNSPDASAFISAWKNEFKGEGERDLARKFWSECLTTKGKPWEYECEWRLVSHLQEEERRNHPLPKDAIKAVYIGIKTPKAHREQLTAAIGDRYPCFDAELDFTKYEIKFRNNGTFEV